MRRRSTQVSLLFSLLLLASCSPTENSENVEGSAESRHDPPLIELVQPQPCLYTPYAAATGTVKAREEFEISAPLSAEISEILVLPGDRVEKDELIAILSTKDLERRVEELRSRLATKNAEIRHRERSLADTKREAYAQWSAARRTAMQRIRLQSRLNTAIDQLELEEELVAAGGLAPSAASDRRRSIEDLRMEMDSLLLRMEEELRSLFPEEVLELADPQESSRILQLLENDTRRSRYIERRLEKGGSLLEVREAERREVLLALRHVEAEIGGSRISAADGGVIRRVFAKEGEFVERGSPIGEVYTPSRLYIETALGESRLGSIGPGTEAIATHPAYDGEVSTRVEAIGPNVDPRNKSFSLRLSLPPSGKPLKPGSFVELEIAVGKARRALRLPGKSVRALSGAGSGEVLIFIPRAGTKELGKLRSARVEILRSEEDEVCIAAGIEPGTLICAEPSAKLGDGAVVRRKDL